MDSNNTVLEIINNLRIVEFGAFSVEAKHKTSLERSRESSGNLALDGKSKVILSESRESIKVDVQITIAAYPDDEDQATFNFRADYEVFFDFYDDKHLLLEGSDFDLGEITPLLTNMCWSVIRPHVQDSLDAASYRPVSLPFFLPKEVINSNANNNDSEP